MEFHILSQNDTSFPSSDTLLLFLPSSIFYFFLLQSPLDSFSSLFCLFFSILLLLLSLSTLSSNVSSFSSLSFPLSLSLYLYFHLYLCLYVSCVSRQHSDYIPSSDPFYIIISPTYIHSLPLPYSFIIPMSSTFSSCLSISHSFPSLFSDEDHFFSPFCTNSFSSSFCADSFPSLLYCLFLFIYAIFRFHVCTHILIIIFPYKTF